MQSFLIIFLILSNVLTNVLIDSEFDFFTSNSRNIYTIKNNTITQYSLSGEKLKQYSNPESGNITGVDAGDMFRLLIFYKDFNQIQILDNQLAPLTDVINLDLLGINETPVVCSSYNNGFWIYNVNNYQLEKYNYRLELLQKGTRLDAIIDRSSSPDFLDEYQNKLYLAFKNKGIYVFDIFGAFVKFIPLKYNTQIQIVNNYIFYDKDSLYKYNLKSFEISNTGIPAKNISGFRVEQNKILLAKENKVFISP